MAAYSIAICHHCGAKVRVPWGLESERPLCDDCFDHETLTPEEEREEWEKMREEIKERGEGVK